MARLVGTVIAVRSMIRVFGEATCQSVVNHGSFASSGDSSVVGADILVTTLRKYARWHGSADNIILEIITRVCAPFYVLLCLSQVLAPFYHQKLARIYK